jgi:hypothetical protein
MQVINVQVKLQGKYAETFEKIKDRPEISPTRKNTVTLQELIRKTPEWKQVNK